jgi:hypothetical protein
LMEGLFDGLGGGGLGVRRRAEREGQSVRQ